MLTWILGDQGAALAGWLSFGAALLGLPAIYCKASSASANADSAQKSAERATVVANATHKAVNALESKLSISNASYAGAQLSTLLFMMQKSHLDEAQSHYVGIKRIILQAHHGAESIPENVMLSIRTIEMQLLNAQQKKPFSLNKLYGAVHGLIEQMDDIEKKSKAKKTTELTDANH